MVSLTWGMISLGLGLVAFALPALVAPALPTRVQQWIVGKYEWLTVTSRWRPTLVRRELGGYELTHRSFDKEKRMDEVDDDLDVYDPDNRISRWAGKPFAGVYEKSPPAVDADLAELGSHHHEHFESDRHRMSEDTVNPYVKANSDWQLCDLADAYRLIPNAADPSDPETTQSYIARAMAKYGRSFNRTEALLGLLGFLAGLGSVVLTVRYILKDGSGGGGPEAPIPIGMLDTALEVGVVEPAMTIATMVV